MKADKRKNLPIVEVQHALNDWYDLRLNEIMHVVEGRIKGDPDFIVLNENNIFIKLLSSGYHISIGNLGALLNSDFVPSYNPFKEYLNSLPLWNENDTDYIEELANHIRARDQYQFNHHFKKMLVRTIACAIDDFSFNKQAFILVGGEQNTGKSTFCRYLCPPALNKYIAENISPDKDGLISLSENFIINLDELSTLSKADLNQLKSMFSKDKIRVRHPFGKKSQTDARRASFVGSTNEDTFLTDTTGSVRWLCFDIDSINWDYTNLSIDKVWSQAYALYKKGFKFQLTVEEVKENETRNEQYQQVSMEYEYIQMYFTPATALDFDEFWTTTAIRDYIISRTDRKADFRTLDKLGRALTQLGFARISKRDGESKKPIRAYYVKYVNK